MTSKEKRHFEVQVITAYSEFAGVRFGPFKSEEDTAAALRKKGWIENVNGEEGLWYCTINQCTGINARIIPVVLRPLSKIPMGRSL